MESSSAQVVDLAAFRARTRASSDDADGGVADRADAQAIVDSLLEATPRIDQMPAQLLTDARQFCVDQLRAALPRHADDYTATVELVKRVRTAIRRSVPDVFLLQALADAGGVWPTPGASHWPAAWLHHLDPSRERYLTAAPETTAQRLVDHLAGELAGLELPAGGHQYRRAHVLDRVGWILQQPQSIAILGPKQPASTAHAFRDVTFPPARAATGYPRFDLLVSVRVPGVKARHDIVVVTGDRDGGDDVTALRHAEDLGAIALRLVGADAPASLFATDLIVPD